MVALDSPRRGIQRRNPLCNIVPAALLAPPGAETRPGLFGIDARDPPLDVSEQFAELIVALQLGS